MLIQLQGLDQYHLKIGVFPKMSNCDVKLIDIPKLVGGKRKLKNKKKSKSKNKKGGSAWVATARSYSNKPQSKNHLGKFTKGKQYVQNKDNITSGPMFTHLSLKNMTKNLSNKVNKITSKPFKMSSRVRKLVKNISKSPMFDIFKL